MIRVGLSTTMIQGGRTGIAQYVFALVREMMGSEKLELVLFVLDREREHFEFAAGSCEIVGVDDRFAPPVKNILWHQRRLPGLARELRLDVLHVPSYRRLVGRAPCALVGTIHDLAPFHVRGKYDIARMFYGRVVVKALARRQDRIIAVSGETASDIGRFFGLAAPRVQVIHNGIDHERFFPGDAEAARARVAREHGVERPFILYISRIEHPGKNHVRLIEAFGAFKEETGSDWELVLGGGDWHGAEVVREAARNSPATADIRFPGFIPDEDLPDFYRAARVMCYPSLFEGFGLPPVEAMACGTPVISSTRGALGEVVEDAALTIDPENVPEIAAALARVAGDPSVTAGLVERGLANAGRFRWSKAATAVEAIYREVTAD